MFTLDAFINRRPFLYHSTAIENLANIRETQTLFCTATLRRQAGLSPHAEKRQAAEPLRSHPKCVWLQTQKPLHNRNIRFEGGWQMPDLLKRLDSLIFFWPGTSEGSSSYGARHLKGNDWPSSKVTMIKVRTEDIFAAAGSAFIFFCPYNSGSPRWSEGKPSPRGPDTFHTAQNFQRTLSDVVEVVVEGSVKLPTGAEFSESRGTCWHPLF